MKPEWGARRTCKKCNAAFYDLKKDPITCPKCGKTHTVEDFASKYSKSRGHKIEEVVVKNIEDVVIDDDLIVDTEDLDDDADDLIDAERILEEDV